MSTTNQPEEPNTRLDREVSEILENASRRPISFQDRVAQKRAAVESRKHAGLQQVQQLSHGPLQTARRWALRIPIVSALVIALLAVWINGYSSFLGSVLALVAVAFIFAPYALRRPDDEITYQKRWRGRVINSSAPPGSRGYRGVIDAARDRFGR